MLNVIRKSDSVEALVERCRNNNRRAQLKLYERYAKAMYNICFRMLNVEADAEDVMQEAFIKAFAKMDAYSGDVTFGAWLKRIMVNQCIDQLKKKKRLEFREELPAVAEQPTAEQEGKMNVKEVMNALQELPDKYRTVFSLYYLEGYDHDEIAQIIGITSGLSRSQLSRAKSRLREILST